MYKIFEETQFIGRQVIFLPKCRSTNDIASEKLRSGELEAGDIVISDHQYAGRGQRGNSWESKPGKNLTFSIVLKPSFIHPAQNFYLNIITSLAIFEVLVKMNSESFTIKWPNDIMYKDQKLGGILIENIIQSTSIKNTVIGIGLNVNQSSFNNSVRATSLKSIFNQSFKLNALLNKIIQQFEIEYLLLKSRHLKELRSRYLSHLYWRNEIHTFTSFKWPGKFQGVIRGIDGSGRLRIEYRKEIRVFNLNEIAYLK